MDQLDSFLESEPVAEVDQPAQEPQVNEGVAAEPPSAQEETSVQEPAQAVASEPQRGFVPVAAVLDERNKRQQLEREFDAFRQQVQQSQQPAQQPPPDNSAAVLSMTLNMVESILRKQLPDYDETRNFFLEQANANPYLIGQLRQAENPAMFAYEMGKKLKAVDEIGDPAAYREKVKAELKAELLAEIQGTQQASQQQQALARASDSLASARAVGASTPASWSGPPSIDEILASKRRR